jgi:ligand-binding sensor domain-containing protein
VGTWTGLFRFDPSSPPPQKFEPVRVGASDCARQILALCEDRSGVLWAGTMDVLYRLAKGGRTEFQAVDIGIQRRVDGARPAPILIEDRQGSLWIQSEGQLYRRTRDGRLVTYRIKSGFLTMYEDRRGGLLGRRRGTVAAEP